MCRRETSLEKGWGHPSGKDLRLRLTGGPRLREKIHSGRLEARGGSKTKGFESWRTAIWSPESSGAAKRTCSHPLRSKKPCLPYHGEHACSDDQRGAPRRGKGEGVRGDESKEGEATFLMQGEGKRNRFKNSWQMK